MACNVVMDLSLLKEGCQWILYNTNEINMTPPDISNVDIESVENPERGISFIDTS